MTTSNLSGNSIPDKKKKYYGWYEAKLPKGVWQGDVTQICTESYGKKFECWYVPSKKIWGSNRGLWKFKGRNVCFRTQQMREEFERAVLIAILSKVK